MHKLKILFFAPMFMGYEREIYTELSKKYEIIYKDTNEILESVRTLYYSKNVLLKGILKIVSPWRNKYRNRIIRNYEMSSYTISNIQNISGIDIVFSINGDGISGDLYKKVKQNNPGAEFILYIWDDYKNLFKHEYFSYFNRIFSYSRLDCKKHGYTYLSMFTQGKGIIQCDNANKKIYDIAIIATATDERVKLINKIYKKYKDQYTFFIYMYSPKKQYNIPSYDKALDFREYMKKLSQARCALEIVRCNQQGPTTRVNDCKFTRTKVITTNSCRENYTGNGNNILFINNSLEIPESFVKTPFDYNIVPGLTVDKWIETIFNIN